MVIGGPTRATWDQPLPAGKDLQFHPFSSAYEPTQMAHGTEAVFILVNAPDQPPPDQSPVTGGRQTWGSKNTGVGLGGSSFTGRTIRTAAGAI
jgi:hypothetical protein